jgi:hypothetical protein
LLQNYFFDTLRTSDALSWPEASRFAANNDRFAGQRRVSMKVRVRVSIDEDLWIAVQMIARVRDISPTEYVEQALQTMIGPFETIERASNLISERTLDLNEVSEQIKVIADAVVDAWRAQPAASDEH